MKYRSTKTYNHEVGLSATFRQWKAKSHCSKLHGYPLSFKFEFGADELDENGWVVDFGALKPLKGILENTFDHKTVVAEDDPQMEWFIEGENRSILDLIILPANGCEKFAEYMFEVADKWLKIC
jgi:6-pyruvoyltetrahydropterin/6-carboxytetrahydropterin synthase